MWHEGIAKDCRAGSKLHHGSVQQLTLETELATQDIPLLPLWAAAASGTTMTDGLKRDRSGVIRATSASEDRALGLRNWFARSGDTWVVLVGNQSSVNHSLPALTEHEYSVQLMHAAYLRCQSAGCQCVPKTLATIVAAAERKECKHVLNDLRARINSQAAHEGH